MSDQWQVMVGLLSLLKLYRAVLTPAVAPVECLGLLLSYRALLRVLSGEAAIQGCWANPVILQGMALEHADPLLLWLMLHEAIATTHASLCNWTLNCSIKPFRAL